MKTLTFKPGNSCFLHHLAKKADGNFSFESCDNALSSFDGSPSSSLKLEEWKFYQLLQSHPSASFCSEIGRRRPAMAAKVSTLSDLIQRVACSCLTHPLAHCHGQEEYAAEDGGTEEEEVDEAEEEEDPEEGASCGFRELEEGGEGGGGQQPGETREAEALMEEVFQAVAALKRAYVSLQEAHCPWDPDRISSADGAVVGELKRLGRLRDRFRRGWAGGGEGRGWTLTTAPPLREAVAPYEAALEELKRELKVKEAEVDSLREKVRGFAKAPVTRSESGRKGRSHRAGGRLSVPSSIAPQLGKPTPELFRTCMDEIRLASKSFAAHLLSLMRAARWDIATAVRSIVEASTTSSGNNVAIHGAADGAQPHPSTTPFPDVGAEHAKHALESYVNRKLFHGFENETFYMEGTLSSLLNPDQHRQDCYSQYRDMRGMDPSELLGVLPGCLFGRFAAKKYLAMVHPKMEESLFGGREQRQQVEAGAHPRTGFYSEFLRLAKAVWLLHLLAFALDPAPSHFEASQAAEFHLGYMESVVRFAAGRIPTGWVVRFPVAPGFKLGDGSIVRARVFLVAPGP